MASVHLSFLDKMISRLRPKKSIAVEECPNRGSRLLPSRGEGEHDSFRKGKLFIVVQTWKERGRLKRVGRNAAAKENRGKLMKEGKVLGLYSKARTVT